MEDARIWDTEWDEAISLPTKDGLCPRRCGEVTDSARNWKSSSESMLVLGKVLLQS
jgi:hypothetical protein